MSVEIAKNILIKLFVRYVILGHHTIALLVKLLRKAWKNILRILFPVQLRPPCHLWCKPSAHLLRNSLQHYRRLVVQRLNNRRKRFEGLIEHISILIHDHFSSELINIPCIWSDCCNKEFCEDVITAFNELYESCRVRRLSSDARCSTDYTCKVQALLLG